MSTQTLPNPLPVLAAGKEAFLVAVDKANGVGFVQLANGQRRRMPLAQIQEDDRAPAVEPESVSEPPALKQPGETYLWDGATMEAHEPVLRQRIAIALWLISLLGNALAFGLSFHWPPTVNDAIGVGSGLAYQLVISYIQFVTAVRRSELYYLALIASFVPSVIGYRFIPFWAAQGVPEEQRSVALTILFLLLAVVLIAIDVIPERTLIRFGKKGKGKRHA